MLCNLFEDYVFRNHMKPRKCLSLNWFFWVYGLILCTLTCPIIKWCAFFFSFPLTLKVGNICLRFQRCVDPYIWYIQNMIHIGWNLVFRKTHLKATFLSVINLKAHHWAGWCAHVYVSEAHRMSKDDKKTPSLMQCW